MKNTYITQHFKVQGARRYRYSCARCRRAFKSRYHLKFHREIGCFLHKSHALPFLSLECLDEEMLTLIASYLDFESLCKLLESLPRLLLCHGMKSLWNRVLFREANCEIGRCAFISNNWRRLRFYDVFFEGRDQGRYSARTIRCKNFILKYKNKDDWRACRRKTLWSKNASNEWCVCFKHTHI